MPTYNYDKLSDAFSKINELKNTDGVYSIAINKDITEKNITFPKFASSISITAKSGAVLYTTATSLNPACSVSLDADIRHIGANGTEDGKAIAVKMPKNTTLTLARGSFGAVSGDAKTSLLNVTGDVTVTDLKSFLTVNASAGSVEAVGKVSGIGTFGGTLKLTVPTNKSSAAITNISTAVIYLTAGDINAKTGKYALTKVTVSAVVPGGSLKINVVDKYGSGVTLPDSQVIAYNGGKNELSVTTDNATDSSASDTGVYLYGKEYRAEYSKAVTVNGMQNYPNIEKAFADMAVGSDYTVALNTDVTVSKLTLPKNLGKLTINGNGHAFSFEGTLNIKTAYPVEFNNITVNAVKKEKEQAISINTAGALTLNKVNFTAKTVTLKGTGALVLGDCGTIDAVSGFETTQITGAVTINKSMTVPTVTLTSTAKLTLGGNKAALTVKKLLSGQNGSQIILKSGCKEIALSNDSSGISGKITLVPDGITGKVSVFATKIGIDAIKSVFTAQSGTLSAGKSGKIDLTV